VAHFFSPFTLLSNAVITPGDHWNYRRSLNWTGSSIHKSSP
jgi:hypothetical protein